MSTYRPIPDSTLWEARFWAKVVVGTSDECWLWTGSLDTPGYGLLRVTTDRGCRASRLAWTLAHGDPGEMWVLHRCDVPACVNVAHLFLGTHDDNSADMVAKGRGANRNTSKRFCDHGHEFTEANTYRYPNGQRKCRSCSRRHNRRTNERRRRVRLTGIR